VRDQPDLRFKYANARFGEVMAQIIDYRGSWKLDRHKWKKLVSRSDVLNRAAKHFARQLCDDFANHKTACCWMSNDTLADHFDVDCRTVQRYIKLLKADGWIVDVKSGRKRDAVWGIGSPPPLSVRQKIPQQFEPPWQGEQQQRQSQPWPDLKQTDATGCELPA
jgi:hypothetical protein